MGNDRLSHALHGAHLTLPSGLVVHFLVDNDDVEVLGPSLPLFLLRMLSIDSIIFSIGSFTRVDRVDVVSHDLDLRNASIVGSIQTCFSKRV